MSVASSEKVLFADRLFDGEGWVDEPVAVVVDSQGRVAWSGPRRDVPDPQGGQGRRECELGKVSLLPGFVDTHAHVTFDPDVAALEDQEVSGRRCIEAAVLRMRAMLATGVTTVRDLGARTLTALELRGIAETRSDLPRLLVSGAPVTSPGGHCWFLGGEATDDTLDTVVQGLLDAGVDVIKVMVTGGYHTRASAPEAPQFDHSQLRRIVGLAHGTGVPVTAHAHGAEGVAIALAEGVDGIEHASLWSWGSYPSHDERTAARLRESSAALCLTVNHRVLALLDAEGEVRVPWLRAVLASRATIVAGTDAGISGVRHDRFGWSLVAMARLGHPVNDVLVAATSAAADAIGLGASTGRIRPGLAADLVAVAGDPRRRPDTLTSPRAVHRAGRPVLLPGDPTDDKSDNDKEHDR